MSAKKKGQKQSKDTFERFTPPEIDLETLKDTYLFECALSNNYQAICGAFDVKEHPLATMIVEKGLFNKRDPYGKTVLDLAAYCGNKEFIKAILDRSNEKLDENVLNLRHQLKSTSSGYNLMHLACIWNREEVVKFLAEHSKLILDPFNESGDLFSASMTTVQQSSMMRSQVANPLMKTLGCVLVRAKAKTGETPKEIAKRYGHASIVEYLDYAEKRQDFIDSINDIKLTISDPEKHQNKISKDDRKKLEKLYVETLEWLEKNKETRSMEILDEKIKEIDNEVKPIMDAMYARINDAATANNNRSSTANLGVSGFVSARSKLITPMTTK